MIRTAEKPEQKASESQKDTNNPYDSMIQRFDVAAGITNHNFRIIVGNGVGGDGKNCHQHQNGKNFRNQFHGGYS